MTRIGAVLTIGYLLLQKVSGTFPPGQHEPLNAILSANSDAAVLKDQQDNGGLRNYFQYVHEVP